MEERGEYVNFRAEVQPSGNGILTGTFSSSGTSLIFLPYTYCCYGSSLSGLVLPCGIVANLQLHG